MAKKKSEARHKVSLQCSECKRKNYSTTKNRKNTPDKLTVMKYCPFDRKHTEHKESKI